MRGTWLRYLGFLGFLGLLGWITGNPGLAGFFGFFGFFGFAGSRSDERLEANINRAARNAFVVTVLVYVAAILIATLWATDHPQVLIAGFAVSFGLEMFVFGISLAIYEARS